MLLTEPFFKTFTKKEIADARRSTEVLLALSADSRDEVNGLVERAVAGGGHEARDVQDEGFMYSRAFEDPDGHIWEVMWMDMAAFEAQQAASTSA